jgi:hypothetical protein
MKASELKSGDKVFYLDDIPATVRSVRSNGIVIDYWGLGFRRDQNIIERVSVRTLSPRADGQFTPDKAVQCARADPAGDLLGHRQRDHGLRMAGPPLPEITNPRPLRWAHHLAGAAAASYAW